MTTDATPVELPEVDEDAVDLFAGMDEVELQPADDEEADLLAGLDESEELRPDQDSTDDREQAIDRGRGDGDNWNDSSGPWDFYGNRVDRFLSWYFKLHVPTGEWVRSAEVKEAGKAAGFPPRTLTRHALAKFVEFRSVGFPRESWWRLR